MMTKQEPTTVCPSSRQQWRAWLQEHHADKQSVWLIYYKKQSATPSITWREAVDEALCFGWIDSQVRSLDSERYMQFFSPRKSKSGWSKVNKANVQRLIAEGRMTKAGFDSIDRAKQNGSWTTLDDVEELLLPADLAQELEQRPKAKSYYLTLSKTDKRTLLQWLVLAKRPVTRQKRIAELVELAEQQLKPKLLQWPKR